MKNKSKLIGDENPMKYKNIAILAILMAFLLLCSLSTISAADVPIDNTTSGGINGAITAGTTNSGDTILLNPGNYTGTNNTGITINKNITIKGNGPTDQVIIDAEGQRRIFIIAAGTNVTFINITFLNGMVSTGGAISNSGNLEVSSCNFINNTAGTGGGAIVNSGNLEVSSCNFINNTAGTGGGAISNSGNLEVSSCNFINNTATNTGGAISTSGALEVSSCNFINNSAGTGGGAISNNGNGAMQVSSSNFINNTATNTGGAISTSGALEVSSCNFINNSAGNNGGAIATNENGTMEVTSSNFTNNAAIDSGGAIYNGGSMLVSSNVMNGNTANRGNAIFNSGVMGILNLTYIGNSTLNVRIGQKITLYATLTDDMGNPITGRNISFYRNGVLIGTATSVEGKANLTYTVTTPTGLKPVSGEYTGNGDFDILISNGLLNITKGQSNLSVNVPKNVRVGETVTLESRLTDENGNPIANAIVDFYVDGKKVGSAITDSNGVARLKHTFTKGGNPTITAKFEENENYLASKASNQTTVSKIRTKLTVERDGNKIIATLTDEDGNPIPDEKITLRDSKGRVLGFGITNENGQVIFAYSANKAGLKVVFEGSDKYTPATADVVNNDNDVKAVQSTATVANMKDTGMPFIPAILALITCLGILVHSKK